MDLDYDYYDDADDYSDDSDNYLGYDDDDYDEDYVDYDNIEVDGQDLEAAVDHFYETINSAYGSDLYDDVFTGYGFCFGDVIIRYDSEPVTKVLEDVNSVLDLYIISEKTTELLTEVKLMLKSNKRDYDWLLEAFGQIKKKTKVIV